MGEVMCSISTDTHNNTFLCTKTHTFQQVKSTSETCSDVVKSS